MKIIYAGTPEISISSLEAINNSSHEISLVLTMPDKISGRGKKIKEGPIKKFSKAHGLKVFQPENLKNLKDQEKISSLNPDLIVVFAYGKILPKEILSIPRLGCLNVHTSLLPKYRGAAPIQRAIFNDERKTGLSFIKMDEGLDTGSIYKSFEIEIEEEETSDTLSKKLSNLTSSLILEVIDNINKNNYKILKQNEDLASYAVKLTKEEALINWKQKAKEVKNMINAFCPNPGAFTHQNEERINFYKAKLSKYPATVPGEILESSKEKLIISANDHSVQILELSRPGKKRMQYKDFANGSRDFFGQKNILA